MTKDVELKAIDELIYEVEMFEQAGVYPIHDFIDNLKTLAAKVKEETRLEGCVVVPVESCKWTQDEDSNWWTQCGEGFVFNEDSHPHKHNFKNCCFCGGLLEAARGGNE